MTSGTAHDLTQGSVGGHLRRQAVPFSLALVAIFSFEAIDLFFIAQLGDAPLAAVSFALPIIWLTYGIGIGFEAGAASVVSRAVGRKNPEAGRRLTTDSVILATVAGTLIALLGLWQMDRLFAWLGTPSELMPLVTRYMHVWYWVAPLDMALWTMLSTIRARGNTLLESKIIVGAAILNLILDPILIFGLFGFPRMEVAGAALATVLSTGVMLLFSLGLLLFRLQVFAPLTRSFSVLWKSWKHLMEIGIPAMITNAIIPVSSGIVVAIIATWGADSVAGYGVAMRVEPLALIPFYALSAVTSPFFGQNSGAGQFERLYEARKIITRFCLAFGLGLAVIISLLAVPIASIYSESESIRDVTVAYLWATSWSWGAYGVVMSVNASFNGSGRPIPGVIISSARVIFVLLPLIWSGEALFGLPGLFGAVCVANLLLGWVAWAWQGRHIQWLAARYEPG